VNVVPFASKWLTPSGIPNDINVGGRRKLRADRTHHEFQCLQGTYWAPKARTAAVTSAAAAPFKFAF
jgi:hypothetical protein